MIKLIDILEAKNAMRQDISHANSFRGFLAYNNLIKLLRKNCSQIIKLYESSHGKYLYRGIKKSSDNIVKLNIRQDRVPGYLDASMHDLANEVVQKMGGVAHRGNSIFCTTSFKDASSWGQVYVVFPIDGFNVTYFTKESNNYMFTDLEYIWKNSFKKSDLKIKDLIEDTYIQRGISFDVESMLKTPSTGKAISEYLINDKFYYAIRTDKVDANSNMNVLLGDVAKK